MFNGEKFDGLFMLYVNYMKTILFKKVLKAKTINKIIVCIEFFQQNYLKNKYLDYFITQVNFIKLLIT